MKVRKPLLLSLVFLVGVAILATLRPPQAASPFIRAATPEGLQFSVLLAEQPTLSACQSALELIEQKLCPQGAACLIRDRACLVSMGSEWREVQGANAITRPSLRFPGGDLVFEAPDSESVLTTCRLLATQSKGRCYQPGETRAVLSTAQGQRSALVYGVLNWPNVWQFLATGFFASLVTAGSLILTGRWHGRFTYDRPVGTQKFHSGAVPRVGGVALATGLLLAMIFMPNIGIGIYAQLAWPLLVAASIAFAFGLLEDLTNRVGVATRLVATIASGVVAWWLLGVTVESIDIHLIDRLLAVTFVSVAFSAVAVAGLANAINIIDGFHGLAAGVVAILLAALGWIARDVGDTKLMLFCLSLIAVICGYLVFNYPWGKIFLGDGGSYLLGFILGWVAVLLPARNPSVSPWASLLICAYPIAETLFSIYRRIKSRADVTSPDREHLHSLFKLSLIRPIFSNLDSTWRNAMVAPPLWVFAALPTALAIRYYKDTAALAAGFLGFCAVYWIFYKALSMRLQKIDRQTIETKKTAEF